MSKTKKELEQEVRIYKAMYTAADKEKMAYLHILEELALNCFYAAQHDIRELREKDYMLPIEMEGDVIRRLEDFINNIIEERG